MTHSRISRRSNGTQALSVSLQAFVINLPTQSQRRESALASIASLGLPCQIVNAVAGADLIGTSSFNPQNVNFRARRRISPNEVACVLSHRLALEAFLDSNFEYGLILEDDARPCQDAMELIAELLESAPGFDVYKIGSPFASKLRGVEIYQSEGFVAVHVYSLSMLAHAYIVTKDGARKLLARNVPVIDTWDMYLRDVHSHGCRACEVMPTFFALTDTNLNDSQIAAERHEAEKTGWRMGLTDIPRYMFFRAKLQFERLASRYAQFGIRHVFNRESVTWDSRDRRG